MMHCIPIIEEIAFLIDKETAAYTHLAQDKADGTIPSEIQNALNDGTFAAKIKDDNLWDMYCDITIAQEILECRYCSGFEGEINSIFPEKSVHAISQTLSDEWIVFIPSTKKAELFKAAYSSPEELAEEFRSFFFKVGIEFPADFDFWAHIVKICGTVFC